MARYCPRPAYKVLKPLTNILAGIPSIVYGFFGVAVIVPAHPPHVRRIGLEYSDRRPSF